eukprot:Filipodium_phascolosomae@DN4888_c0_g1_i1.p1
MGRMYGKGKGISGSAIPYRRKPPTWLRKRSEDVVELILKLARKGLPPSQIGARLRDASGFPLSRPVTGTRVLRVLKNNGIAADVPEDLYHLIKKAVSMRKHMERSRKDFSAKFRLILVEAKIHRLSRYYKQKKELPASWKYASSTASSLIA